MSPACAPRGAGGQRQTRRLSMPADLRLRSLGRSAIPLQHELLARGRHAKCVVTRAAEASACAAWSATPVRCGRLSRRSAGAMSPQGRLAAVSPGRTRHLAALPHTCRRHVGVLRARSARSASRPDRCRTFCGRELLRAERGRLTVARRPKPARHAEAGAPPRAPPQPWGWRQCRRVDQRSSAIDKEVGRKWAAAGANAP